MGQTDKKHIFFYLRQHFNVSSLYVLIVILFVAGSCKKSSISAHQGDTFFKQYDVRIAKDDKTTRTTTTASGAIASDNDGNIYAWYFDSLIGSEHRLAIIKTDKYGKKIWNTSYTPFYPFRVDIDLNNNNDTWQDFFCIGESLYIGGNTPSKDWMVLKINCSDGKISSQFNVNQLMPAYRSYFLLWRMWPTKNGNILLAATSGSPGGFETPILAMMDQSGNLLWVKNSFPCQVADSTEFQELPYCLLELDNNNFIFGTMGMHYFSDGTGNSLVSSTLYFRHMNISGVLTGTDSLRQGIYNRDGNPAFVNSDGAAQIFSVFTSPAGGYIILSTETYDYFQDARVKIIKTDASFYVEDSSYISLGCSVVTSAVQGKGGEIIMSVFSQILPMPNVICNLYKIAPNGSVVAQNQVGLSNQSTFVSGMLPTNDDHVIMGGLIQFANVDTNNLFILKTDNNVHF